MKTFRFLTFNLLNSKLPFVSFGFRYFLVVFERISFYFHFDHSDVRIKQEVSFRYRFVGLKNELVSCTLTSLVMMMLRFV
jgi:hypothetical protein